MKMHQSIESKVKNRILSKGEGWCFTSMNFLDIGNPASIRKALSKLHHQNVIRRLARGLYEYPKTHELLGVIPPDLDIVAQAIAEKNGVRIQPSGTHAANLVGLTGQVPGSITYLTEGPNRKIKIGNQEIIFKSTTKKVMFAAGTKEGLLIQALKNIGKNHLDSKNYKQIARFLEGAREVEVKNNMKFAPAWMRSLVFKIMGYSHG